MRIPSLTAFSLVLLGSTLCVGGAWAAGTGGHPGPQGTGPTAVSTPVTTPRRSTGARTNGIAAERKLPIQISADRIEIDQKTGMAYYRGHVTFVQGGLRITAAKAEANMHNNVIRTVFAQGNPITFLQRVPAPGQDIYGTALRLKYYASEQRLDLYDNVHFRQGSDSLHSARLHYNIATGTMTAVAGSAQEQVHVVIQPQGTSTGPVRSGERR